MPEPYLPDDVARCETRELCPARHNCLRHTAPARDVKRVWVVEFVPDHRGFCDHHIPAVKVTR